MKKEEKEKEEKKEKNSNTYDNLYLVWWVLREFASKEHPMKACEVHKKMLHLESHPSESTVYRILNQRRNIFEDIFISTVIPCKGTVKNVLRRQVESSSIENDMIKIKCLAENKGTYEDYDTHCDKKYDKSGLEESSKPNNTARYYYLESMLEDEEWNLLGDLVRSAPWISQKQTIRFLKVIHQLGGVPYANDEALYAFKRENEHQFEMIHTLQQGIQEKKKVSILYGTHVLKMVDQRLTPYLEPRGTEERVIEPLSLVWSKGNYYLVARYDATRTRHFRVDRMLKATLTQETFIPEVNFSVVKHRDCSPLMYGGEQTYVRFSCPNSLLNSVMDIFGATPNYQQKGENMTVTVSTSIAGMKLFALQHLNEVEILEPASLREDLLSTLEQNMNKYQTK